MASPSPVVHMKDALCRIMEWIFVAEGALGASGFPTAIVRTCALTEAPSAVTARSLAGRRTQLRARLATWMW